MDFGFRPRCQKGLLLLVTLSKTCQQAHQELLPQILEAIGWTMEKLRYEHGWGRRCFLGERDWFGWMFKACIYKALSKKNTCLYQLPYIGPENTWDIYVCMTQFQQIVMYCLSIFWRQCSQPSQVKHSIPIACSDHLSQMEIAGSRSTSPTRFWKLNWFVPKNQEAISHMLQVTIQSHTKHHHLSLHHLVVSREPLEQCLCARNVYSFHEPLPWSLAIRDSDVVMEMVCWIHWPCRVAKNYTGYIIKTGGQL